MLPLKILLVLWSSLLIHQIYFLLMVLILSIWWRNICLWNVGCTDDTVVGNMIKKYATKRQGYIAPRALIRRRYFIIVVGFPGLVQRQGLASWNINILCHHFFSWLLCLSPFHTLLYLLNLFCACFLHVSLITTCFVFVDFLNSCDDSPVRQLRCTGHIHSYDRQLKKGVIWCKKNPISY